MLATCGSAPLVFAFRGPSSFETRATISRGIWYTYFWLKRFKTDDGDPYPTNRRKHCMYPFFVLRDSRCVPKAYGFLHPSGINIAVLLFSKKVAAFLG